jgi:hypothetical protein
MGERTVRRSPTHLGWEEASGWLVLSFLLAVVVVLTLVPVRKQPTGGEASYWLQAESLIRDGDLAFSEADAERLHGKGWPKETAVELTADSQGRLHFDRPLAYPLLLAPVVWVAPLRGPFLLNGLLLALTAVVAGRFFHLRTGTSGPWRVAALTFGSVVFAYAFVALPVVLLACLTLLALAIAFSSEPYGAERLPDLYPGDPGTPRVVLRWTLIGILLAAVTLHHPLYSLLLLASIFAIPQRVRLGGMATLALGAGLVFVLSWLGPGLFAHLGPFASGERVAVRLEENLQTVEKISLPSTEARTEGWQPSWSVPLLIWSGVYLSIGRHLGLLPYFVPVLLLLGYWRERGGRDALLVAVALAFIGLLLFSPFDLGGPPGSLGNRWFVPFYVSLWFVPREAVRRNLAVLAMVAGAAVLWPLWLYSPSPLAAVEEGRFPAGPILRRLPYETTQRSLPVRAEIVTRDVLVRAVGDGLELSGRSGLLVLRAGEVGELLIASPRPLRSVALAFVDTGDSDLQIEGGDVQQMILRPDGGVTFQVQPSGIQIRHPVWWSEEEHHHYLLRIEVPEVDGPTSFSVTAQAEDLGDG